MTKPELQQKCIDLFKLIELADNDIWGDYNWELAKNEVGLPSEITKSGS